MLTANSEDALITELKAVSITIHEVALYCDNSAVLSSSAQSFRLWDLLTSAKDFLSYALSIPTEVVTDLPAAFFHVLPYAFIVLSTVARLPSATGWDSAIAKQEADATNLGLRIKAKFGDELTKTGPDVSFEQKDVWQIFSRVMGGVVAWHQRRKMSGEAETGVDIPISSPRLMTKCGMADAMNAFASFRVRKPMALYAGDVTQDQGTARVVSPSHADRAETQQEDMSTNVWDDEAWQSILDDFSMFPTTAGFPAGQH